MHDDFMRRCFALARRGLGQVSPNPMVGALLVKEGRIIGEGYHTHHGAPHAEPACFNNCTEDPTGATLYVNLEPCCHTKKLTPPCAPLVIAKKIKRLVISNLDPNPAVAGQGVQLIREAGIEVLTGVLEDEGEVLNEIFFHRMRTGLPFVHLKTAMTLDGFTARPDGSSKWITGPEARLDSHWGRLSCDALMIGAQTLRLDDPALTVRIPGLEVKRVPWRIVVTRGGQFSLRAQLFSDEQREKTLIVTQTTTTLEWPEAQVIRLSALDPFPFAEFYRELAKRSIHSLWVEGGAQLHRQFLDAGQVQRVTIYIAPTTFQSGVDAFHGALPEFAGTSVKVLGKDHKISGRLK